jgi:hypothetical protein
MATDEQWVIGLYAVLARDPCDFVDMLEDASIERLQLLLKVLELPGKENTDVELNALGASIVRGRLPPKVIIDHDPGDE